MIGKVLILLATVAASSFANTYVELTLSARDLPNEDICCSPPVYPPDSYAVVHSAPSDFDSYTELGETIVIDNKNNPVWPEIFAFQNQSQDSQTKIRIEVYDADSPDSDDYMGMVEFRIRDVINAFGQTVEKQLFPSGKGYVIINGRINGTFAADAEIEKKFENRSRVIELPKVTVVAARAPEDCGTISCKPEVTIKEIHPRKLF